jgi:large subunit ribosomal protein L6
MKFQLYHHSFNIPDTVTIEKKDHLLKFSGPLGSTYLNLHKLDPNGLGGISLNQKTNQLELLSPSKSFFGLFKKLIENKIKGVTRGFLLYLKINGIGYRANLSVNILFLKLGYSHDIIYKIPSSVKVFGVDPTLLCLFGLDKNQITQIAAKIRNLRRPSVYKGKGIRLLHEKILLKQGKKK